MLQSGCRCSQYFGSVVESCGDVRLRSYSGNSSVRWYLTGVTVTLSYVTRSFFTLDLTFKFCTVQPLPHTPKNQVRAHTHTHLVGPLSRLAWPVLSLNFAHCQVFPLIASRKWAVQRRDKWLTDQWCAERKCPWFISAIVFCCAQGLVVKEWNVFCFFGSN